MCSLAAAAAAQQAGRKQRAGHDAAAITDPALDDKAAADLATAGPLPDDVTVTFVLGGPGSGKGTQVRVAATRRRCARVRAPRAGRARGEPTPPPAARTRSPNTQCAKIVAAYGHTHLSAGDLLRDEVASGSALGKECEATMKEGKLVPMEVIIGLLRAAMVEALRASRGASSAFLIDGFPRALDQAACFERLVKAPQLVLAFDCPEVRGAGCAAAPTWAACWTASGRPGGARRPAERGGLLLTGPPPPHPPHPPRCRR